MLAWILYEGLEAFIITLGLTGLILLIVYFARMVLEGLYVRGDNAIKGNFTDDQVRDPTKDLIW